MSMDQALKVGSTVVVDGQGPHIWEVVSIDGPSVTVRLLEGTGKEFTLQGEPWERQFPLGAVRLVSSPYPIEAPPSSGGRIKAYVRNWRYREPREIKKDRKDIEVTFCSAQSSAAYYQIESDAEFDCNMILAPGSIEVQSEDGRRYICRGFQIEQRPQGGWVICCDLPFKPTD